MLTADGAVHFAPDDVDRNLWHLLHSRETPRQIDVRGISSHASNGSFLAPDKADAWRDEVKKRPLVDISQEAYRSNSIGMKLRLVPAGEYMMGVPMDNRQIVFPEETPEHLVRIIQPFFIGVYEVTPPRIPKSDRYRPQRFIL